MVAHRATHQHKRHGKHQKQTRHFLKVYWPYLPLAMVLSIGLVFSALWQPRNSSGVLAYATSMSTSALLQTTNQDRASNGVAALKQNSQLAQAAQAKANDMVARDYWSHNTPDGNPPWVFITNAGYQYQTAGENLAYGFASSSDTVAGWMASPEHKANMLNGSFVDVGFGYANSSNYQSSGPETIVVAEYAAPLSTSAAPAASSKPASTSSSKPQTKAASQSAPTATPQPTQPSKVAQSVPSTTTPSTTTASAIKSAPIKETATKSVSRLALITQNKIPWLATAISVTLMLSFAALILRHTIALRKWWRKGERYVLHHAIFDVTIISLVGLCLIVSQSSGIFVR